MKFRQELFENPLRSIASILASLAVIASAAWWLFARLSDWESPSLLVLGLVTLIVGGAMPIALYFFYPRSTGAAVRQAWWSLLCAGVLTLVVLAHLDSLLLKAIVQGHISNRVSQLESAARDMAAVADALAKDSPAARLAEHAKSLRSTASLLRGASHKEIDSMGQFVLRAQGSFLVCLIAIALCMASTLLHVHAYSIALHKAEYAIKRLDTLQTNDG